MYRAHRCRLVLGAQSAVHVRRYTPICTPEPASDKLGPLRQDDEEKTLWARRLPVPNVSRAVETWLRFGNDPVVHTALPMRTPHGSIPPTTAEAEERRRKTPLHCSPFGLVEDYMGTNLVFGQPEHIQEGAALWTAFYERKYVGRMRQSRRTAANHIGVVNAPNVFTDEADQPVTRWPEDTFFKEMAYLSERHLKEKVMNMRQLEQALWERASPEAFVAFFESLQQQTHTQVPLPIPSIWFYDGDDRKRWAELYLPVAHASRTFFDSVLAGDIKKHSSSTVMKNVAAALREVHAVLLRRAKRQIKAGIRPEWTSAAPEAKEEWTLNEGEIILRSVQEGDYDPEDLLDDSEEWKSEHEDIRRVLDRKVQDCNFTLDAFWQHTIRREELETEHVLRDERIRRVAAAARSQLYQEISLEALYTAVEDSMSKGQLDMSSAVFRPHFNEVWSKMHYAKFGASSTVQHTTTASRQLLFFYAASPQECAATATLYYATKPLSDSLDYSTPYKLRRSMSALCAAYGLDMAHAFQRPILISAAHLATAEDAMGRISRLVARPYGERRRASAAAARAMNQRFMSPISEVHVRPVASELLEAGADDEAVVNSRVSASTNTEDSTMWPLGSRQACHYRWECPHKEKLKLIEQAEATGTAGRALQLEALRQKGRLEFSLWRRRSKDEIEAETKRLEDDAAAVKTLVDATPGLAEVVSYATELYSRLDNAPSGRKADLATPAPTVSEWVFEVMLEDQSLLSSDEVVELYLPYTNASGKPLPQGEYRLRVRAYDTASNPSCHPTMCSEGFSKPFPVFDAIPQLIKQFSETRGSEWNTGLIKGDDLLSLCAFLRDAGLDVPLACEFEAGQALDTAGNVFLDYFLQLLRSSKYHQSLAERGITEAQRVMEPACRAHWQLYLPGADEEEWAVARRAVLQRAADNERDWWCEDPLLDVSDDATGSTSGLSFAAYPATVRYSTELCTVLTAEGTSSGGPDKTRPHTPSEQTPLEASCVVNGIGPVIKLSFNNSANTSDVSIDDALLTAHRAIQNAQDRHCTLSMFKRGPLEKQAQVMTFCGIHGLEFGGKYARTYCYALEKAKKELEETAVAGRRIPGMLDKDVERLSEKAPDRFASDTNPEQRKTRFSSRVTLHGANIEDPLPDQESSWGR